MTHGHPITSFPDVMGNRVKRHQEDHKLLKKAKKGCKGHFRAQRVKKWKNIDFIAFLCSLGVKNEEDSVF